MTCLRARPVKIRLRRKRGGSMYETIVVIPARWSRSTLLKYVRKNHPEETARIVEWPRPSWQPWGWMPDPAEFTDFQTGTLA